MMLAFLLQLSAEQSTLIGLAIVAALVLLLGLAGEYAEYLCSTPTKKANLTPGRKPPPPS